MQTNWGGKDTTIKNNSKEEIVNKKRNVKTQNTRYTTRKKEDMMKN